MPSERTLRILPDRERVEEELLAAVGQRGVALGADLLTLADFRALLENLRADGRLLIDSVTARVLLGNCAARTELGPFEPVKSRPRFLRIAHDLLASFKSGRCGPESFAEAGRRLPPETAGRVEAIARLYTSYEVALASRRLCDEKDADQAAVARMRDASRPLPQTLAAAALVVFEDLYDWTPLRLELVLALAARFDHEGRGQRVRILLPHEPERPELMGFVDPVYEDLYARASDLSSLEVVTKSYGSAGARPAMLSRSLFRAPAPPWEGPPAVAVLSAANPLEEAREIARRVRDLLDDGTPPETVAVAVRHPEDAAPLVAALERYGVPVRARRGVPLAACPIAALAQRLATLRADGFDREAVEGILSAGHPRAFRDCAGGIVRVLRECGATSDRDGRGRGAFRRALVALEQRSGSRKGRTEHARAALDAITALETATAAIPEGPRRLSDQVEGLTQALAKLGALDRAEIFEGVDERPASDLAASLPSLARDQAAARVMLELLERLVRAFEAAGRAAEPVEPSAFAALLSDASAETLLPAQGPRGGAVRVLGVRELPGRRLMHLFLAGLVEGKFPAQPEPNPLFSEEDKVRLNIVLGRRVFRFSSGASGPLPERQAEEPLLFHLSMCSAQDFATLTFFREGSEGAEALPSRFVDEVRRVKGAASEHRIPLSVLPAARDARTRGELIARASLERHAERSLRASEPDASFDAAAFWAALREDEGARLASIEARVAAERERFLFFARPTALPGRFSGEVGPSEALARPFRFDRSRPLAPRAVGELGNCRFQGFASQVLGLRGEDAADSAADASTKGDLYHRSLERLLRDRLARGLLPLRGDDDELLALDRAIADAADELSLERHVGHPELWRLTLEEGKRMLSRVVRAEAASPPFVGLLPTRFEVTLGEDGLPLLEVEGPEGEGPIFVGGRIDRIDAAPSRFGAVDYKSSRASGLVQRFRERFLESEFQLAVYAAALSQAGKATADAAYVSVRDAEVLKLSDLLRKMGRTLEGVLAVRRSASEGAGEEGKRTLGEAIRALVGDARAGRFPVRPLDCMGCKYAAVCRIGTRLELEDEAP
jgi:RecB family exonuclease